MKIFRLIAITTGLLILNVSFASEAPTNRELIVKAGVFTGQNENLKVTLTFLDEGDVILRQENPSTTIAASLKRVAGPTPRKMGLRFDSFIVATEKKHSEVIATVERDENGTLLVSVLPVSVKIDSDYIPVEQLSLRRELRHR